MEHNLGDSSTEGEVTFILNKCKPKRALMKVYKYKYMLIIAINTSKYTNILRMTALHFTYPACL
jgi:hypothetical protein